MNDRTALYIAYDSLGKPLYVGISKDWGKRWAQHGGAPFFAATARLDITWFETRAEAAKVEKFLIHRFKTPHNLRLTEDGRPARERLARFVCDGCHLPYFGGWHDGQSCPVVVEDFKDGQAVTSGGCGGHLRSVA